jgi:hypothetical protein
MHAGPNVAVEPWFAILGAEDDVQDNLLNNCGMLRS